MNSTFIFQVIKKALKSRKVTYQDLSKELGMSESGVKKLLSAKDISLQRLGQICQFLEIPLSEVVRSMERRQIREVALSKEQETALLQEPLLFRIYWRLSVEQQEAKEIKTAESLTAVNLEKAFLKLQHLGLVKIHKDQNKNQSIVPLHRGPVRWIGQGPLLQYLNSEWSKLTLNRAIENKGKPGYFHHLMTLRLGDDEYQQVLRDLNKFIEEIIHRSEKESLNQAKQNQKSRVLMLIANHSGFLT